MALSVDGLYGINIACITVSLKHILKRFFEIVTAVERETFVRTHTHSFSIQFWLLTILNVYQLIVFSCSVNLTSLF